MNTFPWRQPASGFHPHDHSHVDELKQSLVELTMNLSARLDSMSETLTDLSLDRHAHITLGDSIASLERAVANLDSRSSRLKDGDSPPVHTSAQLRAIEQRLAPLKTLSDLLAAAAKERETLRPAHFDRVWVEPMARGIIAIADAADQLAKAECRPARASQLTGIRDQLLQLLARYGVAPLPVAASGHFDAKTMQPLRKIPTSDEQKHGTVQIVQVGFGHGDRVLRPHAVTVFTKE